MSRIVSALALCWRAMRWLVGRLARGRIILKSWAAAPHVRTIARSLPEQRRAAVDAEVAELVATGHQRWEALRSVAENAAELARQHGQRGYTRMMLEDLQAVAYLSEQLVQEKRKP